MFIVTVSVRLHVHSPRINPYAETPTSVGACIIRLVYLGFLDVIHASKDRRESATQATKRLNHEIRHPDVVALRRQGFSDVGWGRGFTVVRRVFNSIPLCIHLKVDCGRLNVSGPLQSRKILRACYHIGLH